MKSPGLLLSCLGH